MKNLLILITFILSSSIRVEALERVELGEYIKICNESKDAFTGYRTFASSPPIIGGEIYRTTFADLCELIVEMEKLQNRMADLDAKTKLNGATELSWEKSLLLAVSVSSLVASKYYDEAQPTDIAEIEDKKEREALEEFYESIGEQDQVNVSRFKDNRVQANRMDLFARAARQRAMLSEGLVCPDHSDNPNYREIYEEQLRPLGIERRRYEAKRDHYFKRLQELGPTFLTDNAREDYQTQLTQLHETGTVIKIVEAEETDDYFSKKPGKNDEVKTVKRSVKVPYQRFYSNTDSRPFTEFKERWKSRWKDYIDASLSEFDNKANIADQCILTPGKPRQTDWLNPDDVNSLASYERACRASLSTSAEARPGFVFDEIIDRYQENSLKYAALKAQLMTKESELLKKPIVFDQRKTGVINLSDQPNCDDTPISQAAMKNNQLKMLAVENEYREIIATERLKESMLREEEMRRQREIAEKRRIKTRLIDNENRAEKAATSTLLAPDLGGSL